MIYVVGGGKHQPRCVVFFRYTCRGGKYTQKGVLKLSVLLYRIVVRPTNFFILLFKTKGGLKDDNRQQY